MQRPADAVSPTSGPAAATRSILLVADACVLIDLAHMEALSALRALAETGWSVSVTDAAAAEAEAEVSHADLAALGVAIVPLGASHARRIAGFPEGALSESDIGSLLLAEEVRGTLWTNDSPLRREAERRGVATAWLFEPLVWLVDAGQATKEDILSLGERFIHRNPRHLADFMKRLLSRLGTRT